MKQFFLLAAVALTSMTASAQFGAQRGNPVVPSVKAEVEDFKPAISNQENKQFPAVNSKRQVRAQIMAPNAKFVGLDIAGKIYEMTKDENGLWTGTSEPQAVRKYIAQRAELLGAVRLPNNAFRANAGTDVVADILFLQKRDHPIEIDEDWLHIGKSDLPGQTLRCIRNRMRAMHSFRSTGCLSFSRISFCICTQHKRRM